MVALGWQFTKGSEASERSSWGATEEKTPLLPPWWQEVGKTAKAVSGSLTW